MRIRIILFCSIILALCPWLVLRREAEEHRAIDLHEAAVTNQPEANQMVQTTGKQQSLPSVELSISNPVMRMNTVSNREVLMKQIENEWRTPIEFYGIIEDESNNVVAGAKVNYSCNDTSPTGTSFYHAQSDENGSFVIKGVQGLLLEVDVNKEGYYSYDPHGQYFYYAGQNHNFVPDANNPVVFHLRKKGIGESLIHVKQNFRVARDGTPLGIDLATGKAITGGTGNLVVQCWTDDQGKRSGQKYDWHCLIIIPNGGLVLSNEEFPFLAPESGYMPTNEIAMPADLPHWKNDVDVKFYYQLPNGDYGRMTFSMIAGGDHFCMIDSLLNPTGSRNLEPQ